MLFVYSSAYILQYIYNANPLVPKDHYIWRKV